MNERAEDSCRLAISEAEREGRKKAVDFARASLGLEGFTISEETEAQARQFVNGEIDLGELIPDGQLKLPHLWSRKFPHPVKQD
jgi:hypothetical protein